METSLKDFRAEVGEHLFQFNKSDFTTPKYHILGHYMAMIRNFGSLLNGDTEVPERLHCGIKAAYKRTNKKGNWLECLARNLDEYFLVDQLYHKTVVPPAEMIPEHGKVCAVRCRPRKFTLEFDEYIEVIKITMFERQYQVNLAEFEIKCSLIISQFR